MSLRTQRKIQIKQNIISKVLELTFKGQSFSNISLRQLAKEIGVVPSALYRYFKDKDELAQFVIDDVSLLIKSALFQSRARFTSHPQETPQQRMISFFEVVEKYAHYWHFFIAERWGGYPVLEEIIKQDAHVLVCDFIRDLKRLPDYHHISKAQLIMYAELVLQLCFTWSMDWIELCRKPASSSVDQEKNAFIEDCSQKIDFLKHALS